MKELEAAMQQAEEVVGSGMVGGRLRRAAESFEQDGVPTTIEEITSEIRRYGWHIISLGYVKLFGKRTYDIFIHIYCYNFYIHAYKYIRTEKSKITHLRKNCMFTLWAVRATSCAKDRKAKEELKAQKAQKLNLHVTLL